MAIICLLQVEGAMSALGNEEAALETRYRRALSTYIDRQDESQLIAAHELGRTMLAAGHGLLDLLTLHNKSARPLLEANVPGPDATARHSRANEFLFEVAAPFEMALRSWHEMADQLRRENEELGRRAAERAAAYREAKQRLDRAQHDLLLNEERWQSLVENPIIGISILGPNQSFIATNRAFQTMIGYSDEELSQLTLMHISVAGERVMNEVLFREMQEGSRQYYEVIKQLRRKDQTLIWIQLYVFAIQDRESGELHTFAMMLDMTERRRAQEALQEARTEIARVGRINRMAAMAASIAHEVNQPLAAMVANANAGLRWLSRSPPDLAETQAVLQKIARDSQRASETIAGIRAMFTTASQTRDALDLNQLIRGVLQLAQGELEKNPIVMDLRLDQRLPLVMADRVQLQQVIFNLVINAVDAMASVTDRDRILRIMSRLDDSGDILVIVEDSGTGLKPEDVDKIFGTFFTTKAQGMGMGLSICRSIIESHGGRMWVSRGHPHGAVFQFTLPGEGRSACLGPGTPAR